MSVIIGWNEIDPSESVTWLIEAVPALGEVKQMTGDDDETEMSLSSIVASDRLRIGKFSVEKVFVIVNGSKASLVRGALEAFNDSRVFGARRVSGITAESTPSNGL